MVSEVRLVPAPSWITPLKGVARLPPVMVRVSGVLVALSVTIPVLAPASDRMVLLNPPRSRVPLTVKAEFGLNAEVEKVV